MTATKDKEHAANPQTTSLVHLVSGRALGNAPHNCSDDAALEIMAMGHGPWAV